MTPRGRRPGIVPGPVVLAEYPPQFLECRDIGHSWKRRDDGKLLRNAAGHIIEFTRVLLCRSCGKKRHDRHDTYGNLLGRYYEDPEGYASTREAPIRGTDARAEEFRRMLADLGETP